MLARESVAAADLGLARRRQRLRCALRPGGVFEGELAAAEHLAEARMIGGGETPGQLELLAVPARGGAGRKIVRWRRGAGGAESTAYISTRPRSDVYRWSLLRSSATDD